MKLNKFKSSEITPEKVYKNRRKFLKDMGIVTGTALLSQNIMSSALFILLKLREKLLITNMLRPTIITMNLALESQTHIKILKILLQNLGKLQLMEK